MKKTLAKGLALAFVGSLFVAGSAMALPLLTPGYNWTEADYWHNTDETTGADGNSSFSITLENAGYESDFGLYSVDNISNPTTIIKKIEIFDYNTEKNHQVVANFKWDSGVYQIQVYDKISGMILSDYEDFSNVFGFYYDVHTGGANDTTVDYNWYTDKSLNSDVYGNLVDNEIEHVLTAWNPTISEVTIYLDDQLGGGDRDFTDMTVCGNDIAPVPEPATMLLFGSGLVGIATLRRRKANK